MCFMVDIIDPFVVWSKVKGGDYMNIAIQKSEQGYRVVAVAPFTDEEGNPAAEILSVHNQAEVEWYKKPENAIDNAYDLVRQPAPWSHHTTIHHAMLGPSIGGRYPGQFAGTANVAYWIKERF